MSQKELSEESLLSYFGGAWGALTPFALFLAGVTWLGISGAPDERGFWPILLIALAVAMFLARDRRAWCEITINGMSRPIVMLMIMAWLLAGVLGELMKAGGLVESLVWLAQFTGLQGGGFTAGCFLACCAVSTATGTSLGTILICAPLLYPAGGSLAAEPVMLMAAILGGATFGDNISPVSDTTIASAMTQDADMGRVIISRLRYALPAAAISLLVFARFGGAEVGAAAPGVIYSAGPKGLFMLPAPIVVIALLLKRRHLVEGLLTGIVCAITLGLGLRLFELADLLYIDKANFVAKGLLATGLEKGVGVSIFTLLMMGLAAGPEAAGIMTRLMATAKTRIRSERAAEWWIFTGMSSAVLLTTHSAVAILAVGDFTKSLGERFGIDRYRRANLLDVTSCTWPFLLPYFIPTVLAAAMTSSGEAYGMPRLSPFAIGLHNAHSWALLAIILLSIMTGYGRKKPSVNEVTI